MKNRLLIGVILVSASLLLYGCGQPEVISSIGGDDHQNPAVSASNLFDVSGAKAIATASRDTISTSHIRASSSSTITELLKLDEDDKISSIFTEYLASTWHPPISVIETGPDGSLYIGFQWGIWVETESSTIGASSGQPVAFFRIKPDGTVEIVDKDIYGVGTWYGHSENGELPVKQVQFDSDGNMYYVGMSSSGTSALKKKAVDGTISQLGTNKMAVRDFLVCPNGFVLFHGSNADNWNVEWLRLVNGSTVNNIFYNDGASGWLRAYYNYSYGGSNYIFLVGENLTLLDADEIPRKYSGIIRVTLNDSGKPTAVEAVYDDNNMYNETHTSIGDQLSWGYWDPLEMTNKKFFATNDYGQLELPLSFEAGVTEADVKAFIRKKYQSITTDTLDSVAFAGVTTTETWMINYLLNDMVTANITGKTWAKWREENGLIGVRFGNAKQLLFSEGGKLYAVMNLDSWGAGTSKGDKLFQIVNDAGSPEIVAFPQDTTSYYKSMSKARIFGNYAIYLSNKVGMYKIFRLDITDNTAAPVDMIPDKTNIEIFSFNYNADTSMLYYDVYDLGSNTSYLASQAITSTSVATEISAEGYTITDVVPFTAVD
ncbi:MAG: hypothetical protein KKA31_04845 [Candidatus Margulisbacteria bacterium]|nr:hypothetical protein [Candidatus Margulisiibacteriota bacterium]